MNFLSSELRAEDITPGIYYTTGADSFWLGNAERIFRSKTGDASFSLHCFDKINSLDEVFSALETYNFSGEPNVVIVKDGDFRLSEGDKKRLCGYVCEDGYLLFVNAKFFGDNKKEDKKSGAVLSLAERKVFNGISCEKSDKYACSKYAEKLFPHGIEPKASLLLCDYCNCDMARIFNEAKKLVDYCEGKTTADDVREIVTEDTDLQIYMFVNSLADGRNEQAKAQLKRLLKRGESPSALLAAIVSQFRRLLYASMSGLSDKELADRFGVKEYSITKARENRKLTKKQLKSALDTLVCYENKFKSGLMSEQSAFDAAVARLIAKETL